MSCPPDTKDLRACLLCSLVKNTHQFLQDGCDNCPFLKLNSRKEGRERMQECTSVTFEGMIAMMQPQPSWIAQWQRISDVCLAANSYLLSSAGGWL